VVHDPGVAKRHPVARSIAAVWNYLPTLALGFAGAIFVLFLLGLVDWFGL